MPVKVVQLPGIGDVSFKKNVRSKRLKLYVKPTKQIIVSMPYHTSYESAARFAMEHTSWIIKQQQKHDSGLTKFELGTAYFSKNHVLKIISGNNEKPVTRKNKQEINIFIPEKSGIENETAQEYIRSVFTEIYRFEAKGYLPGRVKELASAYEFKYRKVSIRDNRTNWGSCSGQNNISLNLHLMKLPQHLIDFIILHELAHTKIKNHSAEFHRLVDYITGGKEKELIKEIKKHSTYDF